jgi:hypothetical protein
MRTKGVKKIMLAASLASAIGLSGSNAMADDAATIETYASGTGVTYDGNGNYPVVTAILSAPHGSVYNPGATLDGYTYNNWSYFAADPSGSIDLFYSSSLSEPYSSPTVGDTIIVQSLSGGPGGNYSPFDGIPEIANSSANPLTIQGPGSSGNSPYNPTPTLTTIPIINVGTTLPAGGGINASGLAGTLLQLHNVTISGAGTTWAVHANTTATITDGSGNSMVMFLWASSYSTCAAIASTAANPVAGSGNPVPTGPVNMTGFVDDFYSSSTGITEAEFVPTSITSVPEPTGLAMFGVGGLLTLAMALRRRIA